MANNPTQTPQNNPDQISNQIPGQMKSEMQRDVSGLKQTLSSEADAASRALHDARDAASRKASSFAKEAKEGAIHQAEGAKREASRSLHDFADAIRGAGDKLAESDQSMAANFVREAASGLERFSTSLSNKRLGDMLEDVRSFGRQNPTAFIAGAVLAGLAIGRFVRSTESETDTMSERQQGNAASSATGAGRKPGYAGSSRVFGSGASSQDSEFGSGSSRPASPSGIAGSASSPKPSGSMSSSGAGQSGTSSGTGGSPASQSGSPAGRSASDRMSDQTGGLRSGGESTPRPANESGRVK